MRVRELPSDAYSIGLRPSTKPDTIALRRTYGRADIPVPVQW
jgi:hypothetical protein